MYIYTSFTIILSNCIGNLLFRDGDDDVENSPQSEDGDVDVGNDQAIPGVADIGAELIN